MKGYRDNPELRAAILDQLQTDLPAGKKAEKPRSVIVGPRGQQLERPVYPPNPVAEAAYAAAVIDPRPPVVLLPTPGDTGEQSISAQEEMRMACAWLMSLGEDDAAGALSVIRTLREGWTP